LTATSAQRVITTSALRYGFNPSPAIGMGFKKEVNLDVNVTDTIQFHMNRTGSGSTKMFSSYHRYGA
jgi:hypothetical protein